MTLPDPQGHRLWALVKFWPEAAPMIVPPDAEAIDGEAFDYGLAVDGLLSPVAAASWLLSLAATAASLPIGQVAVVDAGWGEGPANEPLLSAPLSLWRARDGWLLVDTASREAWRNFCATFLNRSAYQDVRPGEAWCDAAINRLATTILDTHGVDDAVGTCLTYQIPAAVIPGWRDRELGAAGRSFAERLAWAAIVRPDDRLNMCTGKGARA